MKRVVSLILCLATMISLSACGCEHDWQDATCTEPKTCSKCGETEGEALEHDWQDATCTEPKKCSLCGETDGQALGHKESNWKTSSTNAVKATTTYKKYCTVCDIELENQTVTLKSLINGDRFILTPKEFITRLGNMLNEMTGNELTTASGSSGTSFACGILSGSEK